MKLFTQLSFQTANINKIKAISTQVSPINTSHGHSALSHSTFIPSAQSLHSLTCTILSLDQEFFNSRHTQICSFLWDMHSESWNIHFLLFHNEKPCTIPNIWLISIDFLIIDTNEIYIMNTLIFPEACYHFNGTVFKHLATLHCNLNICTRHYLLSNDSSFFHYFPKLS